jgi:uncharacterized protein YxjI
MNKKNQISLIVTVSILLFMIVSIMMPINTPESVRETYFCNVHPLALTLDIDVENNDGDILYNVNGEFFSTYEDNLVMQDVDGNVVREMDDRYNFINQNDHAILDGNGILYSCAGNFDVFANSYRLYDNGKQQVGTMEFNHWNTRGVIKNMDGEVIAQYDSNLWMADYMVSIFDNCEIDSDTVLMMFASCVSDIRADS